MVKQYYLITNIGTYDCDVQEFTDLDEALDCYRDLTANGIDCLLAQKCEMDDLQQTVPGVDADLSSLPYYGEFWTGAR